MKEIIRFQTDRDLDKQTFDLNNEIASVFEELLEAGGLDVPKANRPDLKVQLTMFIDSLMENGIATKAVFDVPAYPKVDAFADIITFATGAILKLGHDPLIAIAECGKEINSRVGDMVDGKFEKDLSPEAQANWYIADYSKSVRKVVHKLEINKELVVSTMHVPKLTGELLEADECDFFVDITAHSWRVIATAEVNNWEGHPEIQALAKLAQEQGCKWLVLDEGGDIVDGLPTFDW